MKWHPTLREWESSIEMGAMPVRLRGDAARLGDVGDHRVERFCARIASTPLRRKQADDLLSHAYDRRGYDTDFLVEEGAAPESLLTLLFLADERAVGTFSIRLETANGLLADRGFPAELARLRSEGGVLTELCRFATEPTLGPALASQTLALMLHVLLVFCRNLCATPTTLVMEVSPHHARLWRGLGWNRSARQSWCDRVNTASVLLWTDCAAFVESGRAFCDGGGGSATWKHANPFPAEQVRAMAAQLHLAFDAGEMVLS